MSIELNIRISKKDATLYGSINISQKELVDKFDKLLSIQDFCEYTIKHNRCDQETLSEFINDEDRDHNAMYAWTKSNNIVIWNLKNKFAIVLFNGQIHTLPQNNAMKQYKNSPPDFCFR